MLKTSKNTTPGLALFVQALLLTMPLWFAPAHAEGEARLVVRLHPIVSTWSWTQFGGKCQETFQYRADHTMRSTSGGAVTEGTYRITPQPDTKGFYMLVETATHFNGKKDCSGDVQDQAGLESIRFIQMSPTRDRFLACKTASLDACFGPLGRIK